MDATKELSALLDRAWPGRFDGVALDESLSLGEAGLGLDSVELAELALACETRTGRPLDESLFTGAPPTVGRLVAYFWPAA